MRKLSLSKVYQQLEPGPLVMLATTAADGHANVMAMSWHMMMDFEPPLVGCIVSANNHSFKALKATGECVIAIPALEIADKAVAVGNCSGRTTNKFEAFGLTKAKANEVAAPLIVECPANLECRVKDTRLVDTYNMFVLEVLRAWIDPKQKGARTIHHCGYGHFVVDGKTIRLKSHMR